MSGAIHWPALRAANEARVVRWHPKGVNDWALTDWATATGGEAGEACNAIKKLRRVRDGIANGSEDPSRLLDTEAKAIAAIGEELADTITYLDLLALRAGVSPEDLAITMPDTMPAPLSRFGAMLQWRVGRVCETAMLLEMADGGLNLAPALGNTISVAALVCAQIADQLGIDLWAATVAKFNAVSERYGFPERMEA